MSHDDLAGRSGRVVFLGAVHEAVPALEAVLASPVAELVGLVTYGPELASRTSGFVDLAPLAAERGVPVLRTEDANAPESVAWIRERDPRLIVCVGWTRLLSPELLSVPPRGAIGFHASLLPHNRGRAPVNWTIIRGETTGGNTMMMLAPGVDNGDIVDQREVPITGDDTCATVYDKVAATGAAMLRRHLPSLLSGTAPRRRQVVDHHEPMLPKRTPAMGITSFDRSAREVHDWIRALTRPYAGAFGYLSGERITFWKAEPVHDHGATLPAGTVLGVHEDGVVVTTRSGAVRLLEVQADGFGPEPAPRWFERSGLRPGCVFDPVDARTLDWALGHGPRPEALAGAGGAGGAAGRGVRA